MLVRPIQNEHDVSITGSSCRLSRFWNPAELWEALFSGADLVCEIPPSYWTQSDTQGIAKWGCVFEGKKLFDASFFGILPKDARVYSPERKMILECAWEAMEASGQPYETVYGSSYGVFTGYDDSDYKFLVPNSELSYPATNAKEGHGDVSFTMGFTGPAISVSTACSSSLVAFILGVTYLHRGEVVGSVVGGSTSFNQQISSLILREVMLLSSFGRCKTFDQEADGFVKCEACAVFVLEKRSDCSGLAKVRGHAMNQDGFTKRKGVPNSTTQAKCFEKALEMSKVRVSDVCQYEAQGTATLLSDATEATSAIAVYGKRKTPLVMKSLKTVCGHAEAASGAIGVIGSVLALQKKKIVKHLHFKNLSQHISQEELKKARIMIPLEVVEYCGSEMRIAESHFGFGGTNSHVILESIKVKKTSLEKDTNIVCLSASSLDALKSYAKSLSNHLVKASDDLGSTFSNLNCRKRFNTFSVFYSGNKKQAKRSLDSINQNGPLSSRTREVSFCGSKRVKAKCILIVSMCRKNDRVENALRSVKDYGLLERMEKCIGLGNGGFYLAQALGFVQDLKGIQEFQKSRKSLILSLLLFSQSTFSSKITSETDISQHDDLERLNDALICIGERFKMTAENVVQGKHPFEKFQSEKIWFKNSISSETFPKESLILHIGRTKSVRRTARKQGCSVANLSRLSNPLEFSICRVMEEGVTLGSDLNFSGLQPAYPFQRKTFFDEHDVSIIKNETRLKSGTSAPRLNQGPCKHCSKDILGNALVILNDGSRVHDSCKNAYELLTVRCGVCKDLMDAQDEVVMGDERFHEDCYRKFRVCEHCKQGMHTQEIVLVNEVKVHSKCLGPFKASLLRCNFCNKVLGQDGKMWFNEKQIHISCLSEYRKQFKSEKPKVSTHSLERRNSVLSLPKIKDEMEEALEKIVCSLSGLSEVPIDSSLSDLGLDSMTAVRFREVVQNSTGVLLESTFVFDLESVSDVANFIREKGGVLRKDVLIEENRNFDEDLTSVLARHGGLRFFVTLSLSILIILIFTANFLSAITFATYVLYPVHWSLLPFLYPIFCVGMILCHVLLKWAVVGRYKEGRYPIWGWFFLRWWFIDRLTKALRFFCIDAFVRDTFFAKLWCLSLGAKLSWSVHLKECIFEHDLISMKQGSGTESVLSAAILRPTHLILKPVTLERGSWVGQSSVVEAGMIVPENCCVDDLTFISQEIKQGVKMTSGCPAHEHPSEYEPNWERRPIIIDVMSWLLRVVLPSYFVGVAVGVQVYIFDNLILPTYGIWMSVGSLFLLMPCMIVVASLVLSAFKWLIVWRAKEGSYWMHGFLAFRLELYDSLWLSPFRLVLGAWNYLPWLVWLLRLQGASIGRQTVFGVSPTFGSTCWDVIRVGGGCFIGPFVSLKTLRFENSRMKVRAITIPDDSSVGTGSVIQGGFLSKNPTAVSSLSLLRRKPYDGGVLVGSPARVLAKKLNVKERVKFYPWYDLITSGFFGMWFWVILTLFCFACYEITVEFVKYLTVSYLPTGFVAYPLIPWAGLSLSFIAFIFGFPFVGMVVYRLIATHAQVVEHPNWSTSLFNILEQFMIQMYTPIFGGSSFFNLILRCWGGVYGSGCFIDSPFFSDIVRHQLGKNCIVQGIVDPHGPDSGKWSMRYGKLVLGMFCVIERNAIISTELVTEDHTIIRSVTRVIVGDKVLRGSSAIGSPAKVGKREDTLPNTDRMSESSKTSA